MLDVGVLRAYVRLRPWENEVIIGDLKVSSCLIQKTEEECTRTNSVYGRVIGTLHKGLADMIRGK